MAFDLAQTFFVDSQRVKNATEIGITKVELFFRAKPKAIGNKSGINYPGVTVTIIPTRNGRPLITPMTSANQFKSARREWGEIVTSSTAETGTVFSFDDPVLLETNREYAFAVKFDGHEDFVLWFNKVGENLVGTTTKSTGSNNVRGMLFDYVSPASIDINSNDDPLDYVNEEYLDSIWKPQSAIDLKYKVYVARYAHGGVPCIANSSLNNDFNEAQHDAFRVTGNTVTIVAGSENLEFVSYNRSDSNGDKNLTILEEIYQPTVHYPGGTATPLTISVSNTNSSVIANAAYVLANGATFAATGGFSTVFSRTGTEYIVVDHGSRVEIRQLLAIDSNNQITVDRAFEIANASAKFYRSPVAFNGGVIETPSFGGKQKNIILKGSNANASVRFVNNTVNVISVVDGGSGYSNSDYVTISGYEHMAGKVEGGYPAVANVVTHANGSIASVYLSNVGCGFVNTGNITVSVTNSTGGAVTGGANLNVVINTVLRTTADANVYIGNCTFHNLPISSVTPDMGINSPLGSNYTIKHGCNYFMVPDSSTSSGVVYYVDDTPEVRSFNTQNLKTEYMPLDEISVFPSRSNQFHIRYANGASANSSVYGARHSNACYFTFDFQSDNDYSAVYFIPSNLGAIYTKYNINNDYTDEHTNYGNAIAKHVMTKVFFADDRFAEDALVYLTAYRPVGTDLKVYARLHNSSDYDAFDDKDWTLLEQIDGIGVYSSTTDLSDRVELTYGVPQYPNTEVTFTGTVETTNASANVVGVGTNFDAHLANNDMVRIYSPLFPNNYVIDIVTNVVNSTVITLANPITNDNVLGPGFKVDKVKYPKQAFKNELNDKVVRYYNSDGSVLDTYNTYQIKVVMLSNNETIVPRFGDIKSVGTTA